MGKFLKDLTGHVYGRLTVVSCNGNTKWGQSTWLCNCSCGKEVTVTGSNMTSGTSKSCGCLSKEGSLKRFVTHGMTGTATFESWQDILKRCKATSGKSKLNYSDRGLTVHEDFKQSFEAFHKEIGVRPEGSLWSVGRICNDIGYTYGNLRWEQPVQQARNKTRYSNNKTGVSGVTVLTRSLADGSTYLVYMATCSELDKTKTTKSFNGKELGNEAALLAAIEWRVRAIERLNLEGAGYADSHGGEK